MKLYLFLLMIIVVHFHSLGYEVKLTRPPSGTFNLLTQYYAEKHYYISGQYSDFTPTGIYHHRVS